MKFGIIAFAFAAMLAAIIAAQAQATSGDAVSVTAENFIRAETDIYFSGLVKQGTLGKFHHRREPANIDKQDVIRMNRDTLYSAGGV